MSLPKRLSGCLIVVSLVAAACGGGTGESTTPDRSDFEPIDPNYLVVDTGNPDSDLVIEELNALGVPQVDDITSQFFEGIVAGNDETLSEALSKSQSWNELIGRYTVFDTSNFGAVNVLEELEGGLGADGLNTVISPIHNLTALSHWGAFTAVDPVVLSDLTVEPSTWRTAGADAELKVAIVDTGYLLDSPLTEQWSELAVDRTASECGGVSHGEFSASMVHAAAEAKGTESVAVYVTNAFLNGDCFVTNSFSVLAAVALLADTGVDVDTWIFPLGAPAFPEDPDDGVPRLGGKYPPLPLAQLEGYAAAGNRMATVAEPIYPAAFDNFVAVVPTGPDDVAVSWDAGQEPSYVSILPPWLANSKVIAAPGCDLVGFGAADGVSLDSKSAVVWAGSSFAVEIAAVFGANVAYGSVEVSDQGQCP